MFKRFFQFRHEWKIKKLLKSGIQVGKNTLLFNEARNFGFDPQKVAIGKNCVVAAGVKFITNPGIPECGWSRSGSPADPEKGDRITVHDNCFIGIDSILYPNISIGPNTIIGAGTVVMTDAPPGMCVSGNPSRVSCTVDLYAGFCKRGMVPDYVSKRKRKVLQKHFWNIRDDVPTIGRE
jgi:acetyltransferase-like isoleucine patch superfamily enzyme